MRPIIDKCVEVFDNADYVRTLAQVFKTFYTIKEDNITKQDLEDQKEDINNMIEALQETKQTLTEMKDLLD